MNQHYSPERNVQIVIALLKAHKVRRIIVSPGSTNIALVGSLQHDEYFELYSCVDERSAAYMACGMAAESGEAIALSCTGATASRNYFPGLTEAFYRKLPVLAITSSQDFRLLGHLKDQITDRRYQPADIVNCSVFLQTIRDKDDEWDVTVKANNAILALKRFGGGPSHINLETTYSRTFQVEKIKPVNVIHRYTFGEDLPELPNNARVAIFIGSHKRFSIKEQQLIEQFCESKNAVVFKDLSSNYYGKYSVNYTLASYKSWSCDANDIDILIHIGEISGFTYQIKSPRCVWRVNEDGEIRDRFRRLTDVFQMTEEQFFQSYITYNNRHDTSFYEQCQNTCRSLDNNFPDIPFSNIWIASVLNSHIPLNSVVHLGILSSLRSWMLVPNNNNISTDANQGGFGIDGNLSTLIGASQIHPSRLYFGIVGDLSFFYDINSLTNRHIGPNIRILLVNNGCGAEFRLFNQLGGKLSDKDIDLYISASGHNGNKSTSLVKDFVQNLGFKYITASTKEDFIHLMPDFVCPTIGDCPIVFEVFTKVEDENNALKLLSFSDVSDDNRVNPVKIIAEKIFKK